MKKHSRFAKLMIRVAKALPVAVIVGILFGMVAYMICVSVFPLGYRSVAEFLPQMPQDKGIGGLEMVSTDAFYEHVANAYSAQREPVSVSELKNLLVSFSEEDGKIVFAVSSPNAMTSYFTVKTALESAEYFYSVQEGSISILSEADIPTSMTRQDITVYLIIAVIIGFISVLLYVVISTLFFSKKRIKKKAHTVEDKVVE